MNEDPQSQESGDNFETVNEALHKFVWGNTTAEEQEALRVLEANGVIVETDRLNDVFSPTRK